MVQEALKDSHRIKPGMKRMEVEKHFISDGGLQFPDNWRYTHPRCEYIKLEIEFESAPNRGRNLTSPDDKVKKVSKLYIDYPTKD